MLHSAHRTALSKRTSAILHETFFGTRTISNPGYTTQIFRRFLKQATSSVEMSIKQEIRTEKAPAPIGPYSQAIAVPSNSKTIYLCGVIGLKPGESELLSGIEAQTEQALKNMGETLQAAGASYADVVKTTVLLKTMTDFNKVNVIYAKYFGGSEGKHAPFPARACYEVARLPKDGLIEIESIAVVKQ